VIDKKLMKALEDLLDVSFNHSCNDLSHKRKEYHQYGEDCPAIQRLEKSRDIVLAFIDSNKKGD
jgi:hypothetical protein